MPTKKKLDGTDAVAESVATPKKRTRIVKKDIDHVYSATQDQGERFDSREDEIKHLRAAKSKAKDSKAAAIIAIEQETILEPPKKKRGRPSKADLAAKKAYEEALARQRSLVEAAQAALNGTVTPAPKDEPEPEAEVAVETPEVPQRVDEEEVPEFIKMQQTAMASEASQETPSVSATADADDDDVPEFIKMQQASSEPVATPEGAATGEELHAEANPSEGATAEEAAAEEAVDYTTFVLPNGKTLAQSHADGEDFVIDEDIPTLDSFEFNFNEPRPAADYDRGDSAPHFRKFSEDDRIPSNQQRSASSVLAAAQSLVNSSLAPAAEAPSRPRKLEITIESEGVLELDNQKIGYLRSSDYNYMPSPDDIYVNQQIIRNYGLKTGDVVVGTVRVPKEGEKYYTLLSISSINGLSPQKIRDRVAFEHLTPLFPDQQFKLAPRGSKVPLSCRIVDLFSPIGKGQRGLIVAQPKTGKTILMKQVANAIAANYPDAYLMMLLIDERPEEVTDMARTVNAEVIASTFDEPATHHVRIANMVLEKAKRMVECGHDVVIFLDSITRLARAFNNVAPGSGKILTGGVDANALQHPKRFFGAARNIEDGGSLTIIATALTDTGSKMDEVIFEEFKGTGNMELQLDRNLANKRIFPAVNLIQSSTRREDLLLDDLTINRMIIIRNFMADMSPIEGMTFIKKRIENTVSNDEFIATMEK